MAEALKVIEVVPGGELDQLLAEAGECGLILVREGVRFQMTLIEPATLGNPGLEIEPPPRIADEHDIWAGYDPERVREAIHVAAGTWADVDTETLKDELYRAREEVSRWFDQPRAIGSKRTRVSGQSGIVLLRSDR